MTIDFIGRICRNRFGNLDIDNIQLYTKNELIREYIEIDYLDKDEVEDIGFDEIEPTELQEVAMRNEEYLTFTKYEEETTTLFYLDRSADLEEVDAELRKAGLDIITELGILDVTDEDQTLVRNILNKLGIFYDVVTTTQFD